MFKSTYFNRSLICLIVTAFFLLHIAGRIEIPLLNKIENIVYDIRLSATTPNTVDPRIVIVDIDEKSLAQEGRWPWSRDKLSFLVDILFGYYQINVLGFDIVFAEPDTSSGLQLLETLQQNTLSDNKEFNDVVKQIKPQLAFDDLFANSLKNRDAVLSYYFNANGTINPNSSLPEPVLSTQDTPTTLLKAKGYGGNLSTLQDAATAGGYFNNDTVDSDGSYRRLPLLMTYNDEMYETLALAMYRKLMNIEEITFGYGEGYAEQKRLESIQLNSLSIPVDNRSVALVPYRGKQGSFNYISATDVLSGVAPVEALNDKIVLFGATAAGILDLRTTPVQNIFPGVEVHANILSGMLDGSFKSKPDYMLGAEFLELFFLAALVIFLYPKLSSIQAISVFTVLIVAMFSLNIYLWKSLNIDSILATPIILLFILFLIQVYFGYFLEAKKKNKLGKIFGQYIPKELVSEMSHSEHEYSLKGESKEMTVLFSDVRGFTSISETMSPEDLCELINEILTPVTHTIHQHQGTIDKYIGDAVMAFWGAPLDNENHAHNAVTAALSFAPVINQINDRFKEKGWPNIEMGIGLNTGVMNVGNMGSEFRMAYTIMGDAVNLGSRLEGLTKQYGVQIIVSETTKYATPDIAYLELDRVRVKGKKEPVSIYEPLGLNNSLTTQQLSIIEKHDIALSDFHQQNWQQAKSAFITLSELHPEKLLFKLYLERIDEYLLTPPETNWDGVFTHKSK
jgi:adenylate cyclase